MNHSPHTAREPRQRKQLIWKLIFVLYLVGATIALWEKIAEDGGVPSTYLTALSYICGLMGFIETRPSSKAN